MVKQAHGNRQRGRLFVGRWLERIFRAKPRQTAEEKPRPEEDRLFPLRPGKTYKGL